MRSFSGGGALHVLLLFPDGGIQIFNIRLHHLEFSQAGARFGFGLQLVEPCGKFLLQLAERPFFLFQPADGGGQRHSACVFSLDFRSTIF